MDMGMEMIDEVGDRTSEGQAAGVYGAGSTVGSLAKVGVRVDPAPSSHPFYFPLLKPES